MRAMKRLLVLMVVLALPLAAVAMAGAAPPKCSDDPEAPGCPSTTSSTTTTTVAPEESLNCAGLFDQWGWGQGSPDDGLLSMKADVDADCNDVPFPGADDVTFRFEFDVTPADKLIKTFFVLGVANSRPGNWCRGHWTYTDESGNVLISGLGNAIRPSQVGDEYSATLVVDEVLDGSNCTSGTGVATLFDADPGWVLTLQRSGGKPLKGTEDITIRWDVSAAGQ